MKIGIIREEKTPIDRRVPLTPLQCKSLMQQYTYIHIVVEESDFRCFSNQEYIDAGIQVVRDLSSCDIILGIKEVPKDKLIANKIYFYFSHTIKKQPYNRDLLRRMIELNIQMVDYEALRGKDRKRLLGFGRYAGIVGSYNGLLTYGLKSKKYRLKPANKCLNHKEMLMQLENMILEKEKIVVTGSGRVAHGVLEVLIHAGIKEVKKQEFLEEEFDEPVFLRLDLLDYNIRIDSSESSKQDFYVNPEGYKSDLVRYVKLADILIAGHYYSLGSPHLLTEEDLEGVELKVIADISCDINGPIASTLRASTVSDPIYGYNTELKKEDSFYKDGVIAVMAIDNLPCELPNDSSKEFGKQIISHIFPLLIDIKGKNKIIEEASICKDGALTRYFSYLKSYIT